jgi:hypothetical protein
MNDEDLIFIMQFCGLCIAVLIFLVLLWAFI